MLEKPDIPEKVIHDHLQDAYGIQADRVTFLPLGADVNTAVYRVEVEDEREYFLKLRKGDFDEITVALPHFLKHRARIQAIIAPLATLYGQLWARLDPYKMILYPYIAGVDGYEQALTGRQWTAFGAALRQIHDTRLPLSLAKRIPHEPYSPFWREQVKDFQSQVAGADYTDPIAAQTAMLLNENQQVVSRLVARAETLAAGLSAQAGSAVLCHSDLHAGNLLLPAHPEGDLYIVDWDNPTFAPKERDLALIGGSGAWNDPRAVELFYQGYQLNPLMVDQRALTYFRCERIVQDIAEFCKQLLLSSVGEEDRRQSYIYLSRQFDPGQEIELALKGDGEESRMET